MNIRDFSFFKALILSVIAVTLSFSLTGCDNKSVIRLPYVETWNKNVAEPPIKITTDVYASNPDRVVAKVTSLVVYRYTTDASKRDDWLKSRQDNDDNLDFKGYLTQQLSNEVFLFYAEMPIKRLIDKHEKLSSETTDVLRKYYLGTPFEIMAIPMISIEKLEDN